MTKINHKHLYDPRRKFGLKKALLSLNRDLDHIKRDIEFNADYGWYCNHSISTSRTELTYIERAILFLEDRRFFSHGGFEFRSALRAIKRYALGGSLNAMSTIDQQSVRISLNRYERSFSRKFIEVLLAVFLNFHVSKRKIFDYYIHNAYLGYKIEGCEIAAQKLFLVSAENLDRKQAAFIASLFPLPFPKSVWINYSKSANYPLRDPSDLIAFAMPIAPRWASRISHRMEIANTSYDRMPRSL